MGVPQALPAARCGNGILTITATMGMPGGTEIRLYDANQVLVASDNSSPYWLNTPILTTHSTFYVESFNASTGCASPRVAVVVSVHPIPGPPIVLPVSRCGSGNVTFTISNGDPAGTSLEVRQAMQGNAIATLSAEPYTFTTPNLTQTTTYYFASTNPTTGCKSEAVSAEARVHQLPAPPRVENVSICQSGTVTFTAYVQSPGGDKIDFYDAAQQLMGTSNQAVANFSATVSQTREYFFKVINTSTGCTSAPARATAFVIPNPGPPTATARAACFSTTVTIVAQMGNPSGNYIILYNANFSAIDTAKASPYQFSRNIAGATTFYVRSYNAQVGCLSQPSLVVASLLTTTPLPKASNVSRCGPGIVIFTFTEPSGARYSVYNSVTGSALLGSNVLPATTVSINNVTTSTTFFAEAFSAAFDCPSPRVPIRADILPLPPAPLAQNQRICGAGSVQLTAIFPISAELSMRLFSESGNLLKQIEQPPYSFTIPPIAQTTTFYLDAVDPQTGCSSAKRSVVIEVIPLPPPPLVPPVQRCGPGSVVLTATSPYAVELRDGVNNVLARAIQTPKLLTTPYLNTNSTLIAVAGPVEGCYSMPVEVNITILPMPQPPLVEVLPRCGPGVVTFSVYNSDPSVQKIHVYNRSGQFLDTLSIGQSYASQLARSSVFQFASFDGTCFSRRISVEAIIHPIPAPPVGNNVRFCSPNTFDNVVFTAQMRQPEGTHVAIYSLPIGGTIISSSGSSPYTLTVYAPISGTQTYYLETIDLNTGCRSERVPVLAHLYPVPPTPIIPDVKICGPGMVTFTIYADAYEEVVIYEQINSAHPYRSFTQFPSEFTQTYLRGTTYFYAESRNPSTGCKSDRKAIEAKVVPLPPMPAVENNGPLCPGETLILRVRAMDGISYQWKGPGGFTATGNIVSIPAVSPSASGAYEVVAVNSEGCSSPSNATNVKIYPLLELPAPGHYNVFQQNIPYCEGVEINLHVLNYPSYPEGTLFEWRGPQGFYSFPHPFPGVGRPTTVANSGVYSVRAIYERCTTEWAETQVVIHPKPQAPTVAEPSYLCISENNFVLSVSNPKSTETYHWIGPNNWLWQGTSIERPSQLENAGVYSVVAVSDKNCISDTTRVQVQISNEPFTVTAAYRAELCEGELLRFDIVSPTPNTTYTLMGPGDFKVITTSPIIHKGAVSLQDAGVYSLVAQRNGCTSPVARYPVVIRPRPAPVQVQFPSIVCQGNRVSMRISNDEPNSSYLWYLPNGKIISANEISISSFQSTEVGVYSVVRIVEGCTSAVDTFSIQMLPTPPKPIAYAQAHSCVGDSIQLHAKLSDSLNVQFVWAGPFGFHSTLSNPKVLVRQAAIYTVTAVMNGCSSLPVTVRISPTPTPPTPILSSVMPVCQGHAFSLSVVNPLAGGVYLWEKDGQILSNPIGFRYLVTSADTFLHSGIYAVRTISNGCTSAAARLRVQVFNPQVSLLASTPICQGSSLHLTALGNINSGSARYIFTGPNNFYLETEHSQGIRQNVQLNEGGNYSVLVIQNGCSASASKGVVVLPSPSVSVFQGRQRRCVGENLLLSATPTPNTNYYWQGPNGFMATGNPVSIQLTSTIQAGVYEVFAIAGNCTSSRGAAVTVEVAETPPTPLPGAVPPLCKGQSLVLGVKNPEPGLSYRWLGPRSFVGVGPEQNISQVTLEHSGLYSVVAIAGNCTSSAGVVTVQVSEVPELPNFSFPSFLCSGQNLTLAAQAIAGATYTWYLPDGSQRESTSPVFTLPQVSTAASGVYGLRISLGNCVSKVVTERIRVSQTPAPPTVRHNSPICEGQDLSLQAIGPVGVSYWWSAPEVVSFERNLPNPIIAAVGTWASGIYTVQAIQEGCTSQAVSAQILVRPKPQAPIVSSNSPLCSGENLQLFAHSPNASSYQWSGPSAVSLSAWSSNQQNPVRSNVTTADAGKYSVWVTREGCVSDITEIHVVIRPTPRVSTASNSGPVCEGSQLNLYASLQSGVQYLWSGPSGFASTAQNPIISPASVQHQGVYSLVVISGSCTSAQTVTSVEVITPPFPPELGQQVTWCKGQGTTLSAPITGGVVYNWIGPNGITANTPTFTIPTVTARNQGTYRLFVQRGNCRFLVREISVTVQDCAGKQTQDSNFDFNIVVYPNPSNGKFEVEFSGVVEGDSVEYTLINMGGQIIENSYISAGYLLLDMESQSDGIYLFRARYRNKERILKLIKQ
ncbi:MAG: T9SS type A sorting domain-containing protein [Bacteroidia bacterium]|nr:T9SS type A sorting domain-containing protein [Bacteroidia bacterium]MDW8157666.1 T9SS type A sorting domain-containing protein [Bacteroidia bacterium]